MSRQGGSEKKVIMADVEPGEKTGVYYMPICNLPFGTSWQDFKDWLRVDCDVDHVELFQSSTSGWIRLRGEENFNKAWSRVKNEYFRNRAIIASDRNRTESIKIKELVDSRVAQYSAQGHWDPMTGELRNSEVALPPSRSCMQEAVSLPSPLGMDHEFGRLPLSIGCPAGPVGTTTAYGGMLVLDPYATMAESYNTISAMRNHIPTYTPGFGYYEPLPEAGPMPASRYSGSSQYGGYRSADAQYASSHQSHASIHFRMPPGTSNYTLSMGGPKSSDTRQRLSYTAEKPCKVVVTSIQHKARQSEVASWIRHQVGEYSSAITGIDIPLVEPKGRIRGHALITLTNPTAAEAAVRILDQKLFQGRVVSTRLATEGITDAERSKAAKDPKSRHHRSESSKETCRSTRQLEKSSRDDANDQKPQRRIFHSSPSPSTRDSSSSKTTEDTVKSTGPVIAHGSSSRKKPVQEE
ncbi:RNA recognition motif (RRM) superfamily protein [Metarhizium robertsii]|uniref:RNA recognition motif domain protein n=2 Tax=Metarhizium robertsii TaxID=568076 RepID=E9F0H2_METRA|nr:RNA recognition motif domain protein [Metarhizium robertsii ARSEF 23]EFY98632.1 RNA recognition motif domain protein [Metarhizium robertsii ARSEF 23]EXV04215.1 RNA recognition motif (RRM) superfamily protein [Metarhizium robertsii]